MVRWTLRILRQALQLTLDAMTFVNGGKDHGCVELELGPWTISSGTTPACPECVSAMGCPVDNRANCANVDQPGTFTSTRVWCAKR